LSIGSLPAPVLASLRWPGRPRLTDGNAAWTYMIETPHGEFALFVGHIANGKKVPFEVWVNGSEQPRGLGAVAKTLSMDMRANDRGWLKLKLDVLAKTVGDESFNMHFPPHGEQKLMPGVVSAVAQVIRYRCERIGAFEGNDPTPVIDTMFSRDEPKTGTDGTSATRPRAKSSCSASRKLRCLTASRGRTRSGCRAIIRAPWTG
jgi:ribonucleoside-diphosphate reductase alpha chain